MRGEESTMRSR